MSTLSDRYAIFTAQQEAQLATAIEAGEPTIDLTYTLPVSAAAAAGALGEILDEADEYCRQGQLLLTLAAPPELVAYRRWFLDQFVDQAAGARAGGVGRLQRADAGRVTPGRSAGRLVMNGRRPAQVVPALTEPGAAAAGVESEAERQHQGDQRCDNAEQRGVGRAVGCAAAAGSSAA